MTVKVTIFGIENGKCALTGKDAEGVRVSFDDGSFTNVFLSHRAFQKIYSMKAKSDGGAPKPAPVAVAAAPVVNNVQK